MATQRSHGLSEAHHHKPPVDLCQYAVTRADESDAAGERGWGAAYRYIAANGRFHLAGPLPTGRRRMMRRACYYNAFRLALYQGLNYAEGVARSDGVTTLHAWAVTDDGEVIDPTWDHPELNQYFGIAVPAEPFVKAMVEMSFGMSMPLMEAVFVLERGSMPEPLSLPFTHGPAPLRYTAMARVEEEG